MKNQPTPASFSWAVRGYTTKINPAGIFQLWWASSNQIKDYSVSLPAATALAGGFSWWPTQGGDMKSQ